MKSGKESQVSEKQITHYHFEAKTALKGKTEIYFYHFSERENQDQCVAYFSMMYKIRV